MDTINQDRGESVPPQVLRLDPLTEIVGSIQRVGEVYLVFECVQRLKVPREVLSHKQIELLREGGEVGVLFMDDGTTRVREVSSACRDNPTVVQVPAGYHAEP